MSVEIKGEQTRVHRDVYARIMIFSNLPTAGLTIEEGDRRLYVTQPNKHKVSVEESKEFFERFVEVLERPETPAQLYHYFLSVPLTDFKRGQHISTDAHKVMIEGSTSALNELIRDYVEDRQTFVEGMLHEHLRNNGIKFIDMDKVKAALGNCGYVKKRREVKGSEKRIYLWQPSTGQKAQSLTDKELKDILKFTSLSFP